jgi:hypothetical protein
MSMTLDEDVARLLNAARDAVAARYGSDRRWSFFIRLSWAYSVTEANAVRDIEAWARRLRRRRPGIAILIGIHFDTGRIHAHALVYIPRMHAPPNKEPWKFPVRAAHRWYQSKWKHGQLWLEQYSYKKAVRPDGKHGTALYAAKDPGSVMIFGDAPKRTI